MERQDGRLVRTSTFRAMNHRFAFEVDDALVADKLELLFTDLVDTGTGAIEVARIEVRSDAFGLVDTGGARRWFSAAEDLVGEVIRVMNRRSLDSDPDRLHLHAGCVTRHGRAVILSANSGVGKSTLTAALAGHGWQYLSDEAVALSPSGDRVFGFPKPFSLRSGARDLLPEVTGRHVSIRGARGQASHVPASAVTSVVDRAAPGVVVVLRRTEHPDAPFVSALSTAEAMVETVTESLDFERSGLAGLMSLARWCSLSRCVQLEVGPLDETCDLITTLLDEAAAQPTQPRADLLTQSENRQRGGAGVLDVPSDVRSVRFDDSVLVYNARNKQVFSLDGVGAEIWMAIVNDEPIDSSAQTMEFLAQLERLECLESR